MFFTADGMADQSLLTILHVSDFHFSKRKQREQGIIVDALVKDLASLCIGHRKPGGQVSMGLRKDEARSETATGSQVPDLSASGAS